ncbi:hypothetical protein ABFA07_004509 [Porites harrisoni]
MKIFFAAVAIAYFIATNANLSVKPTKSNQMRKAQCHMTYNTNFYAGPNGKKLEQQLAEIKEGIREMKRNETRKKTVQGQNGNKITQNLTEFLNEIREMTRNITGGTRTVKGPNCTDIGQQLMKMKEEILEEIKAIKTNKTGGNCLKVYKNCAEVYKSGNKISGVYKINPDGLGEFEVFCDQKTAGGGWTVFQKRRDGSVDFFRGWDDYKSGFGNLNGEFWLGLDKIHRLTVSSGYKLRVDLEYIHGKTSFAEYSSFLVKSERAKYQLIVGDYSGTAHDALKPHRGMLFTTKDGDNDKLSGANCAMMFKSAWWYYNCDLSDLNGRYRPSKGNIRGMYWWRHKPETTRSEMKIRPKNF